MVGDFDNETSCSTLRLARRLAVALFAFAKLNQHWWWHEYVHE